MVEEGRLFFVEVFNVLLVLSSYHVGILSPMLLRGHLLAQVVPYPKSSDLYATDQ